MLSYNLQNLVVQAMIVLIVDLIFNENKKNMLKALPVVVLPHLLPRPSPLCFHLSFI